MVTTSKSRTMTEPKKKTNITEKWEESGAPTQIQPIDDSTRAREIWKKKKKETGFRILRPTRGGKIYKFSPF